MVCKEGVPFRGGEDEGGQVRRTAGLLFAGLGLLAFGSIEYAATALPAAATVDVGTNTGSATGSHWSQLQGEALAAAAEYRGDSALYATTPPTPIVSSTITGTAITVQQRTIVTADSSGTIVLQLSFLGGQQLVVDELGVTSGLQGAALVLQPGSDAIAGAYPFAGGVVTRTTSAKRHLPTSEPITVDALQGSIPNSPPKLDATGGCGPAPQLPKVITSAFGPLIDGLGIIECTRSETLAIIVGLYRGFFTHVGATSGTTGYSSYLGQNAYAPCSYISGTHDFRTSEIWSVNGVNQGGATSGESGLHCT
jgi:hypothetical protein